MPWSLLYCTKSFHFQSAFTAIKLAKKQCLFKAPLMFISKRTSQWKWLPFPNKTCQGCSHWTASDHPGTQLGAGWVEYADWPAYLPPSLFPMGLAKGDGKRDSQPRQDITAHVRRKRRSTPKTYQGSIPRAWGMDAMQANVVAFLCTYPTLPYWSHQVKHPLRTQT